MIGGPVDNWMIGLLGSVAWAKIMSPFVSQKFSMMLAELNPEDLKILSDLMQEGKVTPVIDRTYKLSEVPEALRYLEQGHARGKVVISMGSTINQSQCLLVASPSAPPPPGRRRGVTDRRF